MTVLLVLLGGAVGAPARYLVDRWVQSRHASLMPWGTFTVNAAGSLVLGLVAGAVSAADGPDWVLTLVGTGFCGALTTFSTFGYETVRLAEEGAVSTAAINVVGSVVGRRGRLRGRLVAGGEPAVTPADRRTDLERLAAQGLTHRKARSAAEVVRHLLAVQAQDPRGARLAVRQPLDRPAGRRRRRRARRPHARRELAQPRDAAPGGRRGLLVAAPADPAAARHHQRPPARTGGRQPGAGRARASTS